MKTILTRSALIFFLGFMVLFLLRLGYGYATQPNGEVVEQGYVQDSRGYDFELSRKNYAGQKSRAVGPGPQSVDQRYEKVATLGQSSHAFEDDEARVRAVAKSVEALIQHEQNFGLDRGAAGSV